MANGTVSRQRKRGVYWKQLMAACLAAAAITAQPTLRAWAADDEPKKPAEEMKKEGDEKKPDEMKKEGDGAKPATPATKAGGATGKPPAPAAPKYAPGSPEQVDAALDAAKRHLYSIQKNGNWEESPGPKLADAGDKVPMTQTTQWGGLTSIAVYALLASGDSPQKPELKAAIEFLKKAEITGTYALALRAQVWGFLPPAEGRPQYERDVKLLLGAMKSRGDALGFYSYTNSSAPSYDHSCSQYGVLGVWACADAGFEVPTKFWELVENGWLRDQDPKSGGWAYGKKPDLTPDPETKKPRQPVKASMTAAGVATLFITQDYLHGLEGIECKGNVTNPGIEAGLKWMSEHFSEVRDPYTWYGVERIGVASGYKYFGKVDWYKEGAKFVAPRLLGKGSGGIANTAFEMLFLTRGRAPVAINKLDYDIDFTNGGTRKPTDKEKDAAKGTFWNQRPRDVANLVKYLGHESEHFLNWQIVNLNVDADSLHDAPLLFMSGSQAVVLTKDDEDKLRRYVEQGGMIVCNADCNKAEFGDSLIKTVGNRKSLASKLFPGYEVRKLPDNHIIFTGEQYQKKDWKDRLDVYAVGNGAREFMLVFATGDPAKYWQTRAIGGREAYHQIMMNLYMYSNGRENPVTKGNTYIVNKNPAIKPDRTLKLARLEYGGSWDPEPGGWRRMAGILNNQNRIDLQVEHVKLGEGKLAGHKVAHMTGIGKFKLSDAERAELKSFSDAGGLLVIDSCGGSGEFSSATESELQALFGADAEQAQTPVKIDTPVYSVTNKLTEVTYRQFAKRQLLSNSRTPRLRAIMKGGKPAVYYSPEDLSVGIVGQEVDGIYGYSPVSATAIMQNILVQAAGGDRPAPAAKPADAAAPPPAADTPKAEPPKKAPAKKEEEKKKKAK